MTLEKLQSDFVAFKSHVENLQTIIDHATVTNAMQDVVIGYLLRNEAVDFDDIKNRLGDLGMSPKRERLLASAIEDLKVRIAPTA